MVTTTVCKDIVKLFAAIALLIKVMSVVIWCESDTDHNLYEKVVKFVCI